MSEPKKDFDSVRLMREMRDQISRDIEGMTFEQEKAYIRERLEQARADEEFRKQEHAAVG